MQVNGDAAQEGRSMRRTLAGVVALLFALGGMIGLAVAADDPKYPTKPIQLIVTFAPGGTTDLVARAIAETAKKYLGNIVVLNRAGGSSTIGGNEMVDAPKDGYTLGMINGSVLWQPIYEQTKYDYAVALDPIADLLEGQYAFWVRGSSPWKSVDELVAYAKAHPGEIKYSHSGYGGPMHVIGEIFGMKAGIKLVQVPFKSQSESVPAALGGHVQAVVEQPTGLEGYLASGDLRPLAVSGNERSPALPNVKTFKELGYAVGIYSFQGIAAPKGIPAGAKAKLVEAFKKIAADEEFAKKMAGLSQTIRYKGPEETQKRWQDFVAENRKMVKELGIYEKMRQTGGK